MAVPHGGPRPTNRSLNWVWDIGTLSWLPMTQPIISGGTITVTGVSTAANQTNGTQKTQIVDGAGNVVGSTGNALDVNIKTPSSLPVTGPLTNAELRAAPVVITGAVVAL